MSGMVPPERFVADMAAAHIYDRTKRFATVETTRNNFAEWSGVPTSALSGIPTSFAIDMVIYDAVEEPDEARMTTLVELTTWSRNCDRIEELIDRVRIMLVALREYGNQDWRDKGWVIVVAIHKSSLDNYLKNLCARFPDGIPRQFTAKSGRDQQWNAAAVAIPAMQGSG